MLFFLLIIIASFGINIFLKDINLSKNNETFYHSATLNIEVIEKYKKEGEKPKYFIKSKNLNEPFQNFVIEVRDENLWNLVDTSEHYFINVNWETDINDTNIQDKTTILLQIDKL